MLIQWEELAQGLESRGIRSGEDLDRGLKAIDLSLRKLDGDALRTVEDLPAFLRAGQLRQNAAVSSPVAYVLVLLAEFVAESLIPEFDFGPTGEFWLETVKGLLLALLAGLWLAERRRRRSAEVVQNFLAMDELVLHRS